MLAPGTTTTRERQRSLINSFNGIQIMRNNMNGYSTHLATQRLNMAT